MSKDRMPDWKLRDRELALRATFVFYPQVERHPTNPRVEGLILPGNRPGERSRYYRRRPSFRQVAEGRVVTLPWRKI